MNTRIEYIKENKLDMNYTTLFLLPMLGFSKKFYGDKFVSAYLIDVLKPKLALVFENDEEDEDLKETIFLLQSHDEYNESFYDDENKEVVVILNIPSEYKDDFLKFKKGRYTEFNNDFKEVLLDVHGRITGDGKCLYMVDVLFPDYKAKKYKADGLGVSISDLANGQVMSIPDFEKELYQKVELLNKKQVYGNK